MTSLDTCGRRWAASIACAALTAGPLGVGVAVADEVDLVGSAGYASLGTFLNSNGMKIRLDGEGGSAGTEIDWDRTFGKGEQSRFRLDGVWRFAGRHHLRVMYTDYSRRRTATFDEDIEWGDDVFPVNVEVRSNLGFEIIEGAYEYAFLDRDDYEVAASIGVHYTTFEAGLSATVTSPGGTGSESIGSKASVDAPLPVVGLRGLWNVGGDFYLDGQVQFFSLSIDNYDGDITNARAALLWQPRKLVGVGLGYDYFLVNVDLKKDKFRGSLEWEYSGPQLFFNIAF